MANRKRRMFPDQNNNAAIDKSLMRLVREQRDVFYDVMEKVEADLVRCQRELEDWERVEQRKLEKHDPSSGFMPIYCEQRGREYSRIYREFLRRTNRRFADAGLFMGDIEDMLSRAEYDAYLEDNREDTAHVE